MKAAFLLIAALAAPASTPGCTSSSAGAAQDSDSVACSTGATVSLQTPQESWEAGDYVVSITVAGVVSTCGFKAPDAIPLEAGRVGSVPCSGGSDNIVLVIAPVTTCVAGATDGGTSEGCTPVPGRWQLVVSIVGRPSSVSIRVSRDEMTLLDLDLPLMFLELGTSGCFRAASELTLGS